MQRSVYLPSMHFLFALCIIGMCSSLHGVAARWDQFSQEEFSPAHAAFSFPLLMHAMAVQSYRGALIFFAGDQVNTTFLSVLHTYWQFTTILGTIVAVICILLFFSFLPQWTTQIDTSDENEPPAPSETNMWDSVTYGETLFQKYVSPVVLQANETGVLAMVPNRDSYGCHFVRTRKVPALGFELMMEESKFNRECDVLFDYKRKARLFVRQDETANHYHDHDHDDDVDNSQVGKDAV